MEPLYAISATETAVRFFSALLRQFLDSDPIVTMQVDRQNITVRVRPGIATMAKVAGAPT